MYIFNSKIEDADKLEKSLVGRNQIVDQLEEMVTETANHGTLFQNIVIGPRGSGKTHLLKVLYNRINRKKTIRNKIEIAYMTEDEVGIGKFFDFLVRIFAAFTRWNEDENRIKWVQQKIEELKLVNDSEREEEAKRILLEYLNGKDLIILIENLNTIFKGLKKTGQSKLRDFIQQYTNVSFIATSQALFNGIRDEDMPFHNFFNITHLNKLSLQENIDLIIKLSELENHDDLIEFIKTTEGRGKIKAINEFTQGNHRLIVLFYDFLKTEFKSELSEPFLKTIDKLKPYYESFLKLLSPQQQRIVQHLSLKRNPQTGKAIAQNCFIPHNTISKQMSELQRLGYISAFKSGKERYYELNEPLIRFCFEIGEDKNGIIKLFIDFIGNIYSAKELKEKYLHYKYMAEFQSKEKRSKYKSEGDLFESALKSYSPNWEINKEDEEKIISCRLEEERENYIKQINEKGETKNWINEWDNAIESNEINRALKITETILSETKKDFLALFYHGVSLYLLGKYNDAIKSFQKVLEINQNDFSSWDYLGTIYFKTENWELAIEAYHKALGIRPEEYNPWNNLGISYSKINQFKEAISSFQKAIDLNPKEADAWNNIGSAYMYIGQLDKAKESIEKAIEISPINKNSWYNIGEVYIHLNNHSKAIESYLKAIEIDPSDPEIWSNIGIAYGQNGEMDRAIKAFKKALDITGSDFSGFIPLKNLLSSYFLTNQNDKAVSTFKSFYRKSKYKRNIESIAGAISTLLINSNEIIMKKYLKEFDTIIKNQESGKTSGRLFALSIFIILIDFKKIELLRMEMILKVISDLFGDRQEMFYVIKYLDVGTRYLKKDDKKAIYDLSKEERIIFEKFVLNQIDKNYTSTALYL